MEDEYNGFTVRNMHKLLPLIKFFQEHGGYWWIDQSESHNISIEWNPFLGDGKGKMHDKIFMKRCYDIDHYIEDMNIALVESGNGEVQCNIN